MYWFAGPYSGSELHHLPPVHDRELMNAPNELPGAALAPSHSRSEALAARFAERIAQRLLAPGSRLPSVRDCARQQGISPSTVVAAYDRLQAQGLVEAQRQRGFFVRAARTPPQAALQATRTTLPPPVDATALIRAMFHQGAGLAGPGLGTLPDTWLDGALVQRALRRAIQDSSDALRYGDPAGDSSLRKALARRLGDDLGIAADPARILTTQGATQALDIVARTLLKPGDAVLVDEPGWAVEFARLSRMGMRLLSVPRGPQGPDLEVMRRHLLEHRPRLYTTVSVLHNPTGASLSLASAHQVLKLAEAHDLTIVEDDTYAWLAPPHLPRLAALDGLQRTIYISGFSKILAPNWRVGFLAAAPALMERFTDTKLLSGLTTPALLERAVAWCLEQGLLRRHAERVTVRLAAARLRVMRLVEEAGCRFAAAPAGLFGWVETGVDTELLALHLAKAGWLVAPGRLFHAGARPSTLMRVNFAGAQDARFWREFAQARKALE